MKKSRFDAETKVAPIFFIFVENFPIGFFIPLFVNLKIFSMTKIKSLIKSFNISQISLRVIFFSSHPKGR